MCSSSIKSYVSKGKAAKIDKYTPLCNPIMQPAASRQPCALKPNLASKPKSTEVHSAPFCIKIDKLAYMPLS